MSTKVSNVNSVFCAIDFLSSYDEKSKTATYASLTNQSISGRPDYFISIRADRPSSRATTFSIQIQFAPGSSDNLKDPSYIDRIIDVSGGECYITYGWGNGNVTPTFKCLITGYTVNMSNGVLTYNLNAVGFAVIHNYDKVTLSVDKNNPKKALDTLFDEKYLGSHYTLDISNTGLDKEGLVATTFFGVGLHGNPMELLASIVGGLRVNNQEKNKDTRFILSVDDSISNRDTGKGTIRIKKIDPTAIKTEAEDYTFTWGDPNSQVISWDPQYDGAVAIFASQQKKELGTAPGNQDNALDLSKWSTTATVADNGKVTITKAQSTKLSPSDVGSFYSTNSLSYCNQIENYNKWYNENLGTYAYQATLKVLGEPTLRKIGDIICVIALLGNNQHFSSGYYMITGVSDELSQSGYTTTYDLVRVNTTVQITWNGILSSLEESKPIIYHNGEQFQDIGLYQSYLLGNQDEPAQTTESYLVSITSGTSSPAVATARETITIKASIPPSGKVFDKWIVKSENVTLKDEESTTTTFTMPEDNVNIEATYKNA